VLPELGRGVFVTRKFKKGEDVCEYEGELIDRREYCICKRKYDENPAIYGSFVFEFYHGNTFCAINSTKEDSSIGRLINHSIDKMNVMPHKKKHGVGIKFVALRDIEFGEQLFYDYGERGREIVDVHTWLKT
jgi:SET domain-containing protein